MSRLKRILYIFLPVVFLLAVFVIDVIDRSYTRELVEGMRLFRELLVVFSFIFFYLFLQSRRSPRSRGSAKELGRLLIGCFALLAWAGVNSFFSAARFVEQDARLVPASFITIFLSEILCVAVGLFSISTLISIYALLMTKPKKETRRNWVIFLVVMFGTILSVFPFIPPDVAFLSAILFGVTVLFIIVNSFKQSWIVYLSRREKLYTIFYSLLLLIGFIVLNVLLTERTFLHSSINYFSAPLERFARLVAIFGAAYFGMSLFSTLFHLPTAEVYERKQSELSSLHNLSRLVNQVFDFQDLVNTVTQMTLEVVGAQSAWLELVRDTPSTNGTTMEVVARKNISAEELASFDRAAGEHLRRLVCDSQKVLIIDDVQSDRRTRELEKVKLPIGSMLTVPLLSHGRLIGFLHATKDYANGFDQDDVDVLTTFCDNVTIAIENSKLIARSLERERLQQEMMVAQQIQRRLLPQTLPSFDTLELAAISAPSQEVGGDYYDIVALNGSKLAIAVGDVSGKGVSAAFYMAEVKGIVQSLSKVYDSPRQVLLHANQALMGSLEKKAFISMVYAVVDAVKGELRYARAGHCPILLVSNDHAEFLRPNGLGLGLTDGDIFERATEECALRLNPGDMCFFYTDGLAEARNENGRELGYDGLLAIAKNIQGCSAEEAKEQMWNAIRNYTGETAYTDDMTLVVFKWRGAH